MKLLAIIVNFRTPDLTIRALDALMAELDRVPDSAVSVVDNGSGDDSVARIRQRVGEAGWEDRVSVVASPVNGGFSFGNNLELRAALSGSDPPEYSYLLNSDAFPEPGSLRTLLEFLERRPDVGVAGSGIWGVDGVRHTTAFRFPSLASEFEATARVGLVSRLLRRSIVAPPPAHVACRADWVAGASMMIRRETLEATGLFDEEFFLYFEETDFCRRALESGWTTWYVPDSRVAHIGSATTGMKRRAPRPAYWFASRRHYFRKHYGEAYLLAANVAWLAGLVCWRFKKLLTWSEDVDPQRLARDFVAYNFLPWRRTGPPTGAVAQRRKASSSC